MEMNLSKDQDVSINSTGKREDDIEIVTQKEGEEAQIVKPNPRQEKRQPRRGEGKPGHRREGPPPPENRNNRRGEPREGKMTEEEKQQHM